MSKTYAVIVLFILAAAPAWAAEHNYRLDDVPDSTPSEPSKSHKRPSTDDEDLGMVHDVAEDFYQRGMKALNEGQFEQAEALFDRTLILRPNHQGARDGIQQVMKAYEQDPKKADTQAALIGNLQRKLEAQMADENFDDAETTASEILAIDPTNRIAKKHMVAIDRELYASAIERAVDCEKREDFQGAIDSYKLAMNYSRDRSLKMKIDELRGKLAVDRVKRSEKAYIEALNASQQGKTNEALALCKKALKLDPNNVQAKRMIDRLSMRPEVPVPDGVR